MPIANTVKPHIGASARNETAIPTSLKVRDFRFSVKKGGRGFEEAKLSIIHHSNHLTGINPPMYTKRRLLPKEVTS